MWAKKGTKTEKNEEEKDDRKSIKILRKEMNGNLKKKKKDKNNK